jgi:hAT family C-terminal dimerisation region
LICCRYLAQRPPDGLVNTRLWWKAHAVEYPNLALMFRDIGAIPGSSAPCERIFSGGADLVTATRNRLNSESIQACMCLKGWWTGILELPPLKEARLEKERREKEKREKN